MQKIKKFTEKDQINIAFVGVSGRGSGLMNLMLDTMDDVSIIGVCDLYQDRAEAAAKDVFEKRGNRPIVTTDYRYFLDNDNIDAIITPSSWESHVRVCVDTLLAGKYAASEVGGAYSVQECWDLVSASRKTGAPFMLLENCCYGREEMAVLNMVKQGLFGELVHAEGGYQHDLRKEVALGNENRHYRLNNYKHRNGEVYPTHELGPIAKWLSINRGNRMLSLSSFASKSCGINEWIVKNRGADFENANFRFAQGDVVTTVIKCAHGETIVLTHDTSLPRPYSRGGRLQGTKGIWLEDKHSVFFDGISPAAGWDHFWEDIDLYYDRYEHPLWRWYNQRGIEAGHGGMDYLVLRAFVESVKSATDTPIDVYDSVSWMAVTCLSEDSIAMGGQQVAIPDFTNGAWINRAPPVKNKYCLDEIVE